MRAYFAEMFGTAMLVLLGCGSVAISGFAGGGVAGAFAIGISFGLSLMVLIYLIGPISGCHINPAVSLGMLLSGRMKLNDFMAYLIAQFLGAVLGALVLMTLLTGQSAGYDVMASGFGQNGFGAGYLGEYPLAFALIVEVLATFIFVGVILQVTSNPANGAIAGLVIGLTLALLHMPFLQVTGLSVNPARSFGPALFVGGHALSQVWVFFVGPLAGGALAALVFKKA